MDEPNHFDHLLTVDRQEAQGGEYEGSVPTATALQPSNSNMLGKEEFHALFCVGFKTASAVTRLESLSVDENDKACIECTSALYDTIQDIPLLHFMLMPQGKWMQRAVAIGMFTIPMAASVSAELKSRQMSAQQPAEKSEGGGNGTTAFNLDDYKTPSEAAKEQS